MKPGYQLMNSYLADRAPVDVATNFTIKMKINIIIIAFLSCFSIATFGQSQSRVGLTRRQGKEMLNNAKGFGDFIFGTPPTFYRKFKFKPDFDQQSKRYFSKVPITHEGIKIDSIYLHFYSNKLRAITMYTNKSNTKRLMAYCVKNFGPVIHDYDPKVSLWYGKKKRLSFSKIHNSVLEIRFSDTSLMNDADMADTITTP